MVTFFPSCLSRCHLFQTPASYFLALRSRRAGSTVPRRDPKGHRGSNKHHQRIPDRTARSNYSEGAVMEQVDCLDILPLSTTFCKK